MLFLTSIPPLPQWPVHMELVEPSFTYNSPLWHPLLGRGLTQVVSRLHLSTVGGNDRKIRVLTTLLRTRISTCLRDDVDARD